MNELKTLIRLAGLAYDTWSPGDGVTRYRFFARIDDGAGAADYSAGDSLYTATGRAEAITFLRGFLACRRLTPVIVQAGQTFQGVTYHEPTRFDVSREFAQQLIARGIATEAEVTR